MFRSCHIVFWSVRNISQRYNKRCANRSIHHFYYVCSLSNIVVFFFLLCCCYCYYYFVLHIHQFRNVYICDLLVQIYQSINIFAPVFQIVLWKYFFVNKCSFLFSRVLWSWRTRTEPNIETVPIIIEKKRERDFILTFWQVQQLKCTTCTHFSLS